MSSEFDDDEILGNLKTHRKNILLELRQKGEMYTGELRDAAGVPTGSKNYHLDLLQEWGLIELVGRADNGERVFGLTDEGREFVDEHLANDDQDSRELEQRIAELEREVEQLREEKASREETKERFEKIRENLQGTYWQSIVNEIDKRVADAQ